MELVSPRLKLSFEKGHRLFTTFIGMCSRNTSHFKSSRFFRRHWLICTCSMTAAIFCSKLLTPLLCWKENILDTEKNVSYDNWSWTTPICLHMLNDIFGYGTVGWGLDTAKERCTQAQQFFCEPLTQPPKYSVIEKLIIHIIFYFWTFGGNVLCCIRPKVQTSIGANVHRCKSTKVHTSKDAKV